MHIQSDILNYKLNYKLLLIKGNLVCNKDPIGVSLETSASLVTNPVTWELRRVKYTFNYTSNI